MKTRFYFCGSIKGGRQLEATYGIIVQMLKEYGEVLSEHVGEVGEQADIDRELSDQEIHDRDMEWLAEAELVVAEVTVPSLGVGYEIRRAIELKKPILCLFNSSYGNKLSSMITGSGAIELLTYKQAEELEGALKQFVTARVPRRTS